MLRSDEPNPSTSGFSHPHSVRLSIGESREGMVATRGGEGRRRARPCPVSFKFPGRDTRPVGHARAMGERTTRPATGDLGNIFPSLFFPSLFFPSLFFPSGRRSRKLFCAKQDQLVSWSSKLGTRGRTFSRGPGPVSGSEDQLGWQGTRDFGPVGCGRGANRKAS